MCILTYQAYQQTAPSYICDLIVPFVNTRSLRSNDKCLIKAYKPRLSVLNMMAHRNGITGPSISVKDHLFQFLKLN